VDFSQVFGRKNREEIKEPAKTSKKKKGGFVKSRQVTVIDYKTLPLRSEKEAIQLIRGALDNDSILFERLKKLMNNFARGTVDAAAMYRCFMEVLGEGKGDSMFPLAITTLKNTQKQDSFIRRM
jgi:hypothetical protein